MINMLGKSNQWQQTETHKKKNAYCENHSNVCNIEIKYEKKKYSCRKNRRNEGKWRPTGLNRVSQLLPHLETRLNSKHRELLSLT